MLTVPNKYCIAKPLNIAHIIKYYCQFAFKQIVKSFCVQDKNSSGAEVGQVGPVGSTHKRIIPQNELPKISERERFWLQEESKEKERIAEERQRKVSEAQKLDSDRKKREEAESKARSDH